MKNVKVSVIVPVYNVEKYLAKCLDSLVNQTLAEIEIVVVNDGSPDNSQAIIDDYAARYPEKIHALIKENGGLSDARNFGVAHASGEYIAFVDSDDWVDIDMYELMYNKAMECDSDVVCSPYTDVVDRSVSRNYFGGSMQYFGKSVHESPKILRFANSIAVNKIFRREFWNAHNFRFPVGQWFEDSALIYNVLGSANRVDCVNIPFYYYLRSREDSITNTVNEKIFDIFKSVTSLVEYYQQFPQTPELQDEITFLCLRHTLARVYKFNHGCDKKLAKRFIDECYAFYNANLPGWEKSSYVCASKSAGKRTKIKCYVKRHHRLCKWYYTTYTLRNAAKGLLKSIKKLAKNSKKAFRRLIEGKKGAKKRQEAANEQKRQAIQRNGVAVMCLVQRLLREIGVLSFADFGTMLGIVREGRLLAHDLDMDMGVIIKDKTDMERIRLRLEKFGFLLWRQYVFADNIVEESYRFSGIKVDLNYYVISDTESKTWLFYREPGVEYPDNTRNIVQMTYSPITEFKTIQMQGEDVCIPANAEQLLEEKYGPTWRTPDKGWIYWLSPAATKIPDIGYYIDYKYRRTTEVNEEWFAKQRKTELTVARGYQLKQLSVLKDIDTLCKKHNLPFYLAESTLRFAKHYGKSAPWETNLFISMHKKDYDAFIEIAKAELPEHLMLQHSSVTPEYWLPHLTIRMKDSSEYLHVNLSKIQECCGPCVYVLPLCPVPNAASEEQQKLAKKYALMRRLLMIKRGLATTRDKRISLQARRLSFEQIHKHIDEVLTAYDGCEDCAYLASWSSISGIQKATYPREWFEKTEYIPFEDIQMPLPAAADRIAEQRYGYHYEYMPWAKRKITRNIQKTELSDHAE